MTSDRSAAPDEKLDAPRSRHRDRHGRGLRGALAPQPVPLSRSRAQAFDDLVLDAVEELEINWADEVAAIEFAVEDIPPAATAEFDPDVVRDRGVELGRLCRDGVPGIIRPVVVLYRRPIEARSAPAQDRAELVFAVVAELVAEFLGKELP